MISEIHRLHQLIWENFSVLHKVSYATADGVRCSLSINSTFYFSTTPSIFFNGQRGQGDAKRYICPSNVHPKRTTPEGNMRIFKTKNCLSVSTKKCEKLVQIAGEDLKKGARKFCHTFYWCIYSPLKICAYIVYKTLKWEYCLYAPTNPKKIGWPSQAVL